jgi:hypothetical protein
MPPQKTRPEAEPAETFGETVEKFRKEWAAKRTTAVPPRVYDLKESLGIDDALKSRIEAPRGPRIRPDLVDDVVLIGRRILEIAINEAISQKELHPRQSEWEPWTHIAEASQDAVKALERLFRAIDPHGKDAEHFAPFIRKSRTGGFEASKAGYRAADESALSDARLLMAAKQIISKLHADTLTQRDARMAIYPNSYQDHQKWGFVRIFAEGWVFLTGKMPSKHRDPLKNPFLRVVEAAWTDWHQKASNSGSAGFGEALDAAISSIDEARLNELRSEGPEWADPRLIAWSVRL